VFVVVVLHVMVAQGQLELDHLNRQTTVAQQQYERLRLEVAQLSAPSRIATRAQQLGMVPGGPSTFVTVPDASGPAAQSTPSNSTEDYQKVKPHLETRP
jgi:cell division protein FtsL